MGELSTFLASLFGSHEKRLNLCFLGGWRKELLQVHREIGFREVVYKPALPGVLHKPEVRLPCPTDPGGVDSCRGLNTYQYDGPTFLIQP